MTSRKGRPDFTRAETYMQDQAPAVAERTRAEAVQPTQWDVPETSTPLQRRRAFAISGAMFAAAFALVYLSDRYGPVAEGIAGVLATFAIIASIHLLRPRPLLRFMLVVIALACLAVTFATVLKIHLYGTA